MNRQNLQKQRVISLVTAISFVVLQFSSLLAEGGDQIGSQLGNMGNMFNGANNAMNAGNQSIANGTQNTQQGEATQNMQQVAMGAMQIAQGLLGLLAAAAAAAKGQKSQSNGSNLSGINDYSPTPYQSTVSPTPSTTGSSSLDPGTSALGVTPDDLRKGDLALGMGAIEKNFGIPRDDFLNALKNGVDPKDLLANAPKNRQPMDLLNKISAGLAAHSGSPSESDAARALASSSGSGSLANPAGGLGLQAPKGDTSTEEMKMAGKLMLPNTSPEEDDLNNLAVSPEVRAAMAQKAAQLKAARQLQEMNSWSIFQLVHSRYRKLEIMLYGRVEHTNPNPASGF